MRDAGATVRGVWLNLDAAELDDEPEALTALADALNLACGAHAGDTHLATRALRRAKTHGARVGAHPSYPDRASFGRRPMALPLPALRGTLLEQLAWLRDLAQAEGITLTHVKPHGALYHATTDDPAVARCVRDASREALGEVTLVGMPDGALHAVTRDAGMRFAREGFVDRGYSDNGRLVPRGQPGDVIDDLDAVRARALRWAREGGVDTVCVHGDGAHALAVARAVRGALDER